MKPTGTMKAPYIPAHAQGHQNAMSVKLGTVQASQAPAPAEAGRSEACPNVVAVKVGAPQPRQDIKLTIEGEVAPAPGVEKIAPFDFQRLWTANLCNDGIFVCGSVDFWAYFKTV